MIFETHWLSGMEGDWAHQF